MMAWLRLCRLRSSLCAVRSSSSRTVALWSKKKCLSADAEEGKFPLEGVGHVLAPVIVPHGKAARDLFGESPEAPAHALPDGLERLKAGRPARGMNADALG